jgi:hypothetical protein
MDSGPQPASTGLVREKLHNDFSSTPNSVQSLTPDNLHSDTPLSASFPIS